MERVSGDSGTIASSTNSCGTGFRCLMAKGVSSSGKEALSRLRFVMGCRSPRFFRGEELVYASQADLSPQLKRLPVFQSSPFEPYTRLQRAVRLIVSRLRGRAVQRTPQGLT